MGFPKLEVGDLVLVRQWNGEESVEICQYRGATGNLMLMVYHPDVILKSQVSVSFGILTVCRTASASFVKVIQKHGPSSW